MSAKRILLVEDEAGLVLTLTDRLEMHGVRFYRLKHDTTIRISTWKLPRRISNPRISSY